MSSYVFDVILIVMLKGIVGDVFCIVWPLLKVKENTKNCQKNSNIVLKYKTCSLSVRYAWQSFVIWIRVVSTSLQHWSELVFVKILLLHLLALESCYLNHTSWGVKNNKNCFLVENQGTKSYSIVFIFKYLMNLNVTQVLWKL